MSPTFYSLLIPDYASLLLPFLPATDINSLLLTAKQVKQGFGKGATRVEMERVKQRFPLFHFEENLSFKYRILYLEEELLPSIFIETSKEFCGTDLNKSAVARSVSFYVLGLNAPSTGLIYTDPPINILIENAAGFYIRTAKVYINHSKEFTKYMEITPDTVVWYNKRE